MSEATPRKHRAGSTYPSVRTNQVSACPTCMGHSKQKQSDQQSVTLDTTLAKTLAPEDIRVGDFVTMLHTIAELPSCLWCADATSLAFDEPVRIRFMAMPAGIPLKVQAVCLPFLLVKRPFGGQETLDVRQCRFARLDRGFAAAAWKAHKKRRSKKNRK